MKPSAMEYFDSDLSLVEDALKSIDKNQISGLINNVVQTVQNKKRVFACGFGKNSPICEKFVAMMVSMGIDTAFLHPCTALHGEIGILKPGDLMIVLSKSADTDEMIEIVKKAKDKGVRFSLITFSCKGTLVDLIPDGVYIRLKHEGDLWNLLPNNSSTVSLMVLQTIAIEVSRELKIDLKKDFLPNHPGGYIGKHWQEIYYL